MQTQRSKNGKIRKQPARKLSHRLLSIMLTVMMLMGNVPTSAFASEGGLDFGESMGYTPEYYEEGETSGAEDAQ